MTPTETTERTTFWKDHVTAWQASNCFTLRKVRVDFGDWDVPKSITRSKTRLPSCSPSLGNDFISGHRGACHGLCRHAPSRC